MKGHVFDRPLKALGCVALLAVSAYAVWKSAARHAVSLLGGDASIEAIASEIDPSLRLPIEIRHVGSGIRMKLVRPGEYLRGASRDDIEADQVERPQHRVRLTHAFYLGIYEVTQSQWKRVMGDRAVGDEAIRDGDDFPLHGALIDRVTEFLGRTGLRLPTDAEWEYACRAGDPRPRYGSIDEIAWYNMLPKDAPGSFYGWNFDAPIHRVGLKAPNAWGFYDMLGNVREYCSDLWPGGGGYEVGGVEPLVNPRSKPSFLMDNGELNALRGGCAAAPESRCRASAVEALSSNGAKLTGFRVARDT